MRLLRKFSLFMVLALAMMSSSAFALWDVYTPVTAAQTSQQTYVKSLYEKQSYIHAYPAFYDNIEPLAYYIVDKGAYNVVNVDPKIYAYSSNTLIGYSYWTMGTSTYVMKYKIKCPDGLSTTLKRHISLVKNYLTPNTYLPHTDGTACGTVQNKTSIATVQNLYGSNYTVTRLYADRDIFKVECTSSPYCDVYNGAGSYVPGHQTFYLSNTQRIGYRYPVVTMPETYVRTQDTVSDQTAKDNINVLAYTYFGSYVVWVNYYSNPVYISWFN